MPLKLFKNPIDEKIDKLLVNSRLEEMQKDKKTAKKLYKYLKKLIKEDIKKGLINENQIQERLNHHMKQIMYEYINENLISTREKNEKIRIEYEKHTEFKYNVYFKFIYVKFLHDLSKKYKHTYKNYGINFGTNFKQLKKQGIKDKFITQDMQVTDKGIEYIKENEYIMIYHHLNGKFSILNPYYYSKLLFHNPIYHKRKNKKTIYEIILKYTLHLEKHYTEKKGKYENLEYTPHFTKITEYKSLLGIIYNYYDFLKEYDKALEYSIKFIIRYFTDSALYEEKIMVYAMEKSIHKEIKKIYEKLNLESSKETYEHYIKAHKSLKIPTHLEIQDGFKYWRQFLDTGKLTDKLFEEIDQKYSYLSKIK